MGLDLQQLIDRSQLKGLTVWIEYPGISGFKVEIAWVGKQDMQRIYEAASVRNWNPETRRNEIDLDKQKVVRIWAEQVVKNWKGLTVERLSKLYPIKLDGDISPKTEIEPSLENKIALLWNSIDFENWVLNVATNPVYFGDAFAEAERNLKSVEKS